MANPTTQKADQFKYRIQELIERLPRGITTEQIIEQLEKHGIKRRSFFEHKKIKVTDTRSISEHQLQVYAKILNVPMHQMLNYMVKQDPIQVIYDRGQHQSIQIRNELDLS